MTYGSAWAAAAAEALSVWIALSDANGAHAEAAEALRDGFERVQPGRVQWRVAHWSQFASPRPEPHWVSRARRRGLRGMQELFAGDATPPPLLSILVPRLAFERIAEAARVRNRSLSAVFVDQPPARQMELIRLALPAVRNVGILVGGESKGHTAALELAAKDRALQLVAVPVGQSGLFSSLQSLLADADVLLALPDPTVFNSQTAASLLTTAYRRQVPLIGFSPAWVKAGALLGLYSTPAQVGARGAELLRQALPGRNLPPPQWPREFVVAANPDVARSLGLVLDEARLAEQLRQSERP